MKTVTKPETDVGGQPVIAAIGAFDGVHLGHMQLFETALDIKGRTGLPVMGIAFHPHPKSLVKSQDYETLLTPIAEKQALFEHIGLDYFWPIPFTVELSRLSPREFAYIYLRNMVQAQHVVCGFNFTFGYKGEGTPQVLRELGKEMGFEVTVVPPYTIDGEVVSSTKIRQLIARGEMERAAALLGRPYCVYGTAREASGSGYPRAGVYELRCPVDKFLPGDGVYAVWVRSGCGAFFPGAVSIKATRLRVFIPETATRGHFGIMQLFFVKHIREQREHGRDEYPKEQVNSYIRTALEILEPQGAPCRDGGLFTLINAYDRILNADIP